MSRLLASFALVLIFVSSSFAWELDKFPEFTPTKFETAKISSIGSDTMENLMQMWVGQYHQLQDNVKVTVISQGSATAAAALVEGIADIGPMARPLKTPEKEVFMKRYGFEPTQVTTAYAAVAIYVSDKNPIKSISYEDLEAIYSSAPKRKGRAHRVWSDLGVEGEFGSKSIIPLGKSKSTAINAYFKQQVLLQEDFSLGLRTSANSDKLFKSLSTNENAIVFAEVRSELPKGVKTLSVSKKDKAYSPTTKNIYAGRYPLSRKLSLNFVKSPGKAAEPEIKDFFAFVLSRTGQALVEEMGFVPLSLKTLRAERKKLG